MCGSLSGGPAAVIDRWNRIFEVLASGPRRQIVAALLDAPAGESVSLPEGAANPNLETDRKELRVRLRHHHLPLLESERIVRWEREPLCAYRGCDFEDAAIVLQSLYANAEEVPERLLVDCRTLESELSG
ncbi:hypothetical protein [Natrinema ejinorense]|uniref:Transcriptional regulator n=1 Tax=Natrinema ejinorense TaxID=373386 RepID=A0A2A5QW09_9EURY|nr:hypothetical protein [Natrinema ejinorense]PCR91017.1 hypothetical protein CP557_11060 [Natrinema ejinorense]